MTTLEISVVSLEGLNQQSSNFITLTKLPAHMVYNYEGEQVFRVPVDPGFFSDTYSRLHLQLYKQLGWCLIPPSDIALPPLCYLSYRLRAKHGSRTHLIVNLSIRFHGPDLHTCHPVIGIPVTAARNADCSTGTSGYSNLET